MDMLNSIIAAFVAACTLVAGLSPLIIVLVRKIKDERIKGIAEDAVAFAEQIAETHKKENAGEAIPSDEKRGVAIGKIVDLAGKAGLNVDESKANQLVESVLGKLRLK